MYRDHYQTMWVAFEQICQGRRPWAARGDFMNDWYANHFGERERLIVDPLPEKYPWEFQRWAAFCAASVRWFCSTYEVPSPLWIEKPQYVLAEPWYMDHPPSLWQHLRETTAEEFIQHTIYCGNCVYKNKYERDERGLPLKAHPLHLQERRALVRAAGIRLEREWGEIDRRVQEYMPVALALKAAIKKDHKQIVQ